LLHRWTPRGGARLHPHPQINSKGLINRLAVISDTFQSKGESERVELGEKKPGDSPAGMLNLLALPAEASTLTTKV